MRASSRAAPAGKRVMLMAATAGLTVVIAAVSHSAPAQAPDGTPAAWRGECTGDGKTLDCPAGQQVFQRDTRQLGVSAGGRPAAQLKSRALVLRLPRGAYLTQAVG